MWIYSVSGLIIGFILGVFCNAYLLRGVPRAKYLANNGMRLRYGLLNWFIALLGFAMGAALYQSR